MTGWVKLFSNNLCHVIVMRNCLVFWIHQELIITLSLGPLHNKVIFSMKLNYWSMSQPCYFRYLFLKKHVIRSLQCTVILNFPAFCLIFKQWLLIESLVQFILDFSNSLLCLLFSRCCDRSWMWIFQSFWHKTFHFSRASSLTSFRASPFQRASTLSFWVLWMKSARREIFRRSSSSWRS